MNDVSQIKVENNLTASINQAVAEIGGWRKFISEGDKVLLKANFNTADPFPGSSDIGFLKAVVELTYLAGAGKVIVGGSSTLQAKTERVMEELGVFELERLKPEAAEIYNFDEHPWVKREVKKGEHLKHVSVPSILNQVDKIILLPCCKTHFIARYTGALKLMVGMMRPRERVALHMGHVEEKIAEMNTVYVPDLIIKDARTVFISNGPMDGPREHPNLILASTSRVAIDIAGIKIIQGYTGNKLADTPAKDLTQIKYARELGIE